MAEPANLRNDFDSPWKQALESLFPEFMAFFFPDIHADIDWTRSWEFLDTQLQQIVREAELGGRYADKLVKVWQRSGDEICILVHIEIQSQRDEAFPLRLFTYYYRLRDRFDVPVTSLAVLADADPTWKPRSFSAQQWGCSVRFRFPTVKLLDYQQNASLLEVSNNPFAVVVMAHLKTLETAVDSPTRQRSKIAMVRGLLGRGYSPETIIQLLRFIDWILVLPPERQQQFLTDLKQLQESGMAPYMMTFEREALDRGKQEGRQEAGAELVLDLFQAKFEADLNPAVSAVIRTLGYEDLGQLNRAVLRLDDEAALLVWLLQLPPAQATEEGPALVQRLFEEAFGEAAPAAAGRLSQLAQGQCRVFAEQLLAGATAAELRQWLDGQPG